MATRHVKRCWPPLQVRKILIKITKRKHYTHTRMAEMKNPHILSAAKDVSHSDSEEVIEDTHSGSWLAATPKFSIQCSMSQQFRSWVDTHRNLSHVLWKTCPCMFTSVLWIKDSRPPKCPPIEGLVKKNAHSETLNSNENKWTTTTYKKLNKSHRECWVKEATQAYVLCDSIYIKSPKRQIQSTVLQVRMVVTLGGHSDWKGGMVGFLGGWLYSVSCSFCEFIRLYT